MKKSSSNYQEIHGTDYLFAPDNNNLQVANNSTSPYHAIPIDEEDSGSSDDEPPSSGTTNEQFERWSKDTGYGTEKRSKKQRNGLSLLKRRLPIVQWLPKYSFEDLRGDTVAGISVAFTIIPQGLAMAALSGLPARDGLYSSFVCCFVYAILGTRKEVAIGPTSVLAILIVPQVAIGGTTYSVLLSLFTGIVMSILGLCNLGWIVDFVSYPVMSSFATAAAIVTAASQMKEFFGLTYNAPRFVETVVNFFEHVRSVALYDTLLGLACLIFLLVVQRSKEFRFKGSKTSFLKRTLNAIWSLVVNGRNALVIFATMLLSMATEESDGSSPFILTSEIPLGMPPLTLPSFSMIDPVNGTTTTSFSGVVGDLGINSIVLALIALMEAVAVVKSLDSSARVDSTQELLAIGLSNVAGSFVGAYPVTGSFSRSALNASSGVRTPGGGIVTGLLVILSLVTLAPFFRYIPKTALASTIIASVLPLVKFSDAFNIFKTKKVDLIPYAATLLSCLAIGLEYGLMAGFVVSVVLLLKETARPRISVSSRVTPTGDVFTLVKPDRSVFFPSVDALQDKITQQTTNPEDSSDESTSLLLYKGRRVIVLDCESLSSADSSFAQGVKTMIASLANQGVLVIFYQLRPRLVKVITAATLDTEAADQFYHFDSDADVYKMIRKAYSLGQYEL